MIFIGDIESPVTAGPERTTDAPVLPRPKRQSTRTDERIDLTAVFDGVSGESLRDYVTFRDDGFTVTGDNA